MQYIKAIGALRKMIVNILFWLGSYFALLQPTQAEISIIGSSDSKIKIEKIAVFDEPWALTFISQNDLLVSTQHGLQTDESH